MKLVTKLVNSHRFASRRQATEHQAGQMRRRLFVVVKAVLQEQGIEVGADDQIDGQRRLIQGGLALEITGLPALLQDVLEQFLDAFFVGLNRLPALRSGRSGNLVKLAVLEKQAKARLGRDFKHPPQLLRRRLGPGNGRTHLGLNLAQAVRADRLADGLLGLKELVDVSLGKPDGLGEIGDGRFFVAVAAEMLGGRGHDLVAHVVVGRAAGGNRVSGRFVHGL